MKSASGAGISRILVTGAGGFIGRHLVAFLVEEGYQVVGLDQRFPAGLHGQDRLRLLVGDFRDLQEMDKLLDGIEIVIHLASAHLQIATNQETYWGINVHGLGPFLEIASRKGVQRFVHVSSVGVYGNIKTDEAHEDSPCDPQSLYGKTKLAGENIVREFGRKTGFPVVIIRPAWVFGTYCPRTLKLYKALQKGRFIMIGKGSNGRHPLYIKDMLQAFKLSLDANEALGQTFLIAGPSALTTSKLVETMCEVANLPFPKIRIPYWVGFAMGLGFEATFKMMGKEPPLSRRSLEFFDTHNAFSIDKARNVLGFNPAYSFESGFLECLEWLKVHG